MSESEEMYLISIVRLIESGASEPVPLSSLAEELSIQPVSANQMVRKMEDEGLVEYFPYKGVVLTDEGSRIARRILRHRRLWEVFFVTRLGVPPSEADRLACRMEHITSFELANRLANYLGKPTLSPTGMPIPSETGEVHVYHAQTLSDLGVGDRREIIHLDPDPAPGPFLKSQGVKVGEMIKVLAIGSEGAMMISIGDQVIDLDKSVAEKIHVSDA